MSDSREYPDDVPLGEVEPDDDVVSENTGLEAYIGRDVEDVLDDTGYDTPPEKLDCEWIDPDELYPNEWNPNYMPDHRKDLLVLSLLDNGWTAPILVNEDGKIIDGEHRWKLSKDSRIQDEETLTPQDDPAGLVPVFRVQRDRKEAMIATYQQNYAAGDDDAQKLGQLVERLENDEEMDFASSRMGVTESELEVLLPDDEVLSGDTSELWEVPWDDDMDSADEGVYDERLTMDMLETESQLLEHIFAGRVAEGIVKLARFVHETDMHENVDDLSEPDMPKSRWADGGE